MKTVVPSPSDNSSPLAAAIFRYDCSLRHSPRRWFSALALSTILAGGAAAQMPQLINYQGRVAVAGVNFDGGGQFKFALVNGSGTTTYWSNSADTSPADGVPDAAVSLTVAKGLYSVLLGDATLPNMTIVPTTVFTNSDVRLRVWFNDGSHGWQMLTPDQRIAAVGYAMMAGNVPDGSITSSKIASGAVTGGNIANGTITGAQLASGAVGSAQLASGAVAANLNASGQSGVAHGGMILSADGSNANLLNAGYVKLGRVDMGDVWEQKAGGSPPSARSGHTAVWTGSEMIVWGGYNGGANYLNEGGRYNPAANSWTAVTTTDAPAGRSGHTTVWTGSEMIVWGGSSGSNLFRDGGHYNPVSNRWTATGITGAPTSRYFHSAVWTGNEMIVWGGSGSGYLNDGGRYNPATTSWTAVSTTGTTTARYGHTAVWAGSEMIVWGGNGTAGYLSSGGRYNPVLNSWAEVTTTGAPSPRNCHTAVWTGSEMIVWGGWDGLHHGMWGGLNDGGRYNPVTNGWTAIATPWSYEARSSHTAVWTGSEMIVWGGELWLWDYTWIDTYWLNDGMRYNPTTNSWTLATTTGTPSGRTEHTAVWTGSEMIVWGGHGDNHLNEGGRYSPVGNSWAEVQSNTGAPPVGSGGTVVWTGSEMIVWGVYGSGHYLNDGGRYNPTTNGWTAVTAAGAPSGRSSNTAVWTGSEMIVWGGEHERTTSGLHNDGGRYNPVTDSWAAVTTNGAPSARTSHTAVWTGREMIVWGGTYWLQDYEIYYLPISLNDGSCYNPSTNSWSNITISGAPLARDGHTAVWTGNEMIVWGGEKRYGFDFQNLADGGRYNPTTNSWAAVATTGVPDGRYFHTAVWTGSEMIVWGGTSGSLLLCDGGRYSPAWNSWTSVNTNSASVGWQAVWTGAEMIVWGGGNGSGGRYNPAKNTWTAMTTTGAPAYGSAVWTGSEMIVWGDSGTFTYTPSRNLYLYQRP